jgi:hypothetical protein
MASANPNVCSGCWEMDWNEECADGTGDTALLKTLASDSETKMLGQPHGPAETASEWHQLEDKDGPDLINWIEAEIAAKKALADAAAKEARALGQKLFVLRQHASKN